MEIYNVYVFLKKFVHLGKSVDLIKVREYKEIHEF